MARSGHPAPTQKDSKLCESRVHLVMAHWLVLRSGQPATDCLCVGVAATSNQHQPFSVKPENYREHKVGPRQRPDASTGWKRRRSG